ncbi:MAG TPA: AbrB/MazE/SpoVT family DNA-binding domain-containing protein [Thermoanaerobaculia bacterium]|nr:AbrB/MazE/SpoVT family DNA-binding domain-containing protein [Thermoanaerobaculia bacterium]
MKKASTTVRVSPEYEISLPLSVREEAGIQAGMDLEVLVTERGVRLVPIRPLAELRGLVRRDDTVPVRDEGERF